jgi:hypothetical protein
MCQLDDGKPHYSQRTSGALYNIWWYANQGRGGLSGASWLDFAYGAAGNFQTLLFNN